MSRIVAITGGSSGIGLAAARLFCAAGDTVYILSRRAPEEVLPAGMAHLTADVTDEAALAAVFHQIKETHGHLDLLVANAGYGISGAVETTGLIDAKRQFDVNFFGVFSTVQHTLPLLRGTKNARIILVSSVAARFSVPFQAFYSATKSALNSLAAALGAELHPHGIKVTAVMPGDVRTGFTAAREKKPADSLYPRQEASLDRMERDEQNGLSPEMVARRIVKVSLRRRPPALVTVGWSYRLLIGVSRLLPKRLELFIIRNIYA